MFAASKRRFFIVLLLGVPVVLAGFIVSSIPRSLSYCVTVEVQEYPKSDDRLVEWLQEQKEVVARTVRVERSSNGEQDSLTIMFLASTSNNARAVFSQIDARILEFGYVSNGEPLRNCRPRRW